MSRESPVLLYHSDLAQFYDCDFPINDTTQEISATFSRTTKLNCNLLRDNRTHGVFIFADPIGEQTLKISCADVVDGYIHLKRDNMIKIYGVIAELYDSNNRLYAHLFTYFPKEPADSKMPLLIDSLCKTLKLYMLTDDDYNSGYRGKRDYRFNTAPRVGNTIHDENEMETETEFPPSTVACTLNTTVSRRTKHAKCGFSTAVCSRGHSIEERRRKMSLKEPPCVWYDRGAVAIDM